MTYIAGFDIDGVIADFVAGFRDQVEQEYGVSLSEEDIRGHDLYLALGISKDEAKGLIDRTLDRPDSTLYPGAAEGLAALVEGGVEVHVITARHNGDPDALSRTKSWLVERGLTQGIHFHRIDAVKEQEKYAIDAHLDCFVDDNLVELIQMAEHRRDVERLFVFDHPWNRTVDVRGRFERVRNWQELQASILLGSAGDLAVPQGAHTSLELPLRKSDEAASSSASSSS